MGIVKYTFDGHVKASDLDKLLTLLDEHYQKQLDSLQRQLDEIPKLRKRLKELEADKVLRDDIKRFTTAEN